MAQKHYIFISFFILIIALRSVHSFAGGGEHVTDVQEHQRESDISEMQKIKASYYSKSDASLDDTKFKVLLQLIGSEAENDRPGLDMVVVLHVSPKMKREQRLKEAKRAITFVVKHLDSRDRLSIITFNKRAQVLFPLRNMSSNAQIEVTELVHDLEVSKPGTNFTAGLEEAVRILKDRKHIVGRESAVMLVSHGKPYPSETDGSQVPIHDVPVFAFCVDEYNPSQALQSIAGRSRGGTFSVTDVGNMDTSSLTFAMSQCLAGLLTVVVQDLNLTITNQNSKIVSVYAGNYPRFHDVESDGSITVLLGNLYGQEIRTVLVDLALDGVKEPKDANILEFMYSYRIGDKLMHSTPRSITISRFDAPISNENREIIVEEARQVVVKAEKEARELADDYHEQSSLEAWLKLEEAQTNLERDEIDQSHPMVISLQYELDQLMAYFESPETYSELGRQFALAVELSHGLQRFAARGNAKKLRMFATPAMDKFLTDVSLMGDLSTLDMHEPHDIPSFIPRRKLCGWGEGGFPV